MRVAVMLGLAFWISCALAQDTPFPLIGTSGKHYSAVARGLQISVKGGVVQGVAQVQVQDAPGKLVLWEFRFSGCESGTGSVFWTTRTATGEQQGQQTYWISPARDFPSNFIAPLCDLTKSQWQPMLSRK